MTRPRLTTAAGCKVTSFGDVSDMIPLSAIALLQLPLPPYSPCHIYLPCQMSLSSLHLNNYTDLAAFIHFH